MTLHRLNTDKGGPFGQGQQFAENLVQVDTTSAVFANALSMVTPVLPPGTYRIGVVHQYAASTGSTEGEYRLRLDGATDIDLETLKVASANERKTYANIARAVLTAGSHTFDVDVRRSGGAGTFSIDDIKLELWRVI